ncbi:MAG: tripartite tricarboxylate transporter TctB family protein [Pseudomonadota bacterium]
MDHNKKEQISSMFLLLFSVFICFFSYKLSIGSIHNPGGGFFPFYLGIILSLLSIKNFTKAIAQRKIAIKTIKTPDTGINWKNIIFTVVVLFSYPLLLGILGFPISTFLFTALFLRFVEPQRWSVVLGTGGAVTIVFYFVFQYWLKIQFPSGILGV